MNLLTNGFVQGLMYISFKWGLYCISHPTTAYIAVLAVHVIIAVALYQFYPTAALVLGCTNIVLNTIGYVYVTYVVRKDQ